MLWVSSGRALTFDLPPVEQMGLVGRDKGTKKVTFGILHANTRVIFEKKAVSGVAVSGVVWCGSEWRV